MTKSKTLFAALLLTALCGAAEAQAATVTLTWTNPTTRTDGSTITGALTSSIYDTITLPGQPPSPTPTLVGTGASGFKTPQLAAGSHSFTVVNCETGGACSAVSNAGVEVIVPLAPNAGTNLTGTVGP